MQPLTVSAGSKPRLNAEDTRSIAVNKFNIGIAPLVLFFGGVLMIGAMMMVIGGISLQARGVPVNYGLPAFVAFLSVMCFYHFTSVVSFQKEILKYKK